MDVFGSVVDLYETARPGYPTALADAILAYCGSVPASVVEIGAGTGKGTYGYADPRQAAMINAALNVLDSTVRERPADWMYHDLLAGDEFTNVQVETFRRDLSLARDEYLALVRTFGPFLTRPPELQHRGLDALGRLVDYFGGTVVIDLTTTLTLGTPDRQPPRG